MSETYVVVRGQFPCQWCDKAIALLEERGLSYRVDKLSMVDLIFLQADLHHETVPIILKDGDFIGGYDALEAEFS